MSTLVLKIKNYNWSLMGPGDWESTEYSIYDDQTVKIEETFIEKENKERNIQITKEIYDVLLTKIKEAKEQDIIVEACDGEAWDFSEYENNEITWMRNTGYIYGIKPLEEIATILEKL